MMVRFCMGLWCVCGLAVLPAAAGVAESDIYEPDNTASQAKVLWPSAPQVRTVYPQGETDWLTFSLEATSQVIIEAETNDTEPPLFLFTNGSETVSVDTGASGTGVSRVQAILTSGTYYLRVNTTGSAAVGQYTLTLQVNEAPNDAPAFRFTRLWPFEQQRHDFSSIGAIATTSNSSVLITDNEFDVVQKFTQDGQFLTQFGRGFGSPGHFDDAQGLTSIPDGRVFVADTQGGFIHRYSDNGAYETSFGGGNVLEQPFGIASVVAAGGALRLFVADPSKGAVFIFNPDGLQELTPITSVVSPTHVATGPDDVFVLDPPASGGVVINFTEDGFFKGSLGLVVEPRALTVDENGQVLLGHEITASGVPLLQIDRYTPGEGTPDNEFNLVLPLRAGSGSEVALSTDKRGALYVVQKEAGLIAKYQTRVSPPQLVSVWGQNDSEEGSFARPQGLALGPKGTLFVADSGNHRIQEFSADGEFLNVTGVLGDALGQFHGPSDLAVDEEGLIYVVDRFNHRIQVLDPDLNPVFAFGGFGNDQGQLNSPEGIGIAYAGPDQLFVYVADTGNDRIQVFDGTGTVLDGWGNSGSDVGQFNAPSDVAVAPDGTLYVADRDNGRVQRFFPGTNLPAAAWPVGDLARPESLYIDSLGRIFVSDSGLDRVSIFTAWGERLTNLGSRGTSPGQFRAPNGITAGVGGKVFISDSENHRIQEFSLRLAQSPSRRAILIAGSGPFLSGLTDNPIWDPTIHGINLAYRALRHQGYAKDDIRLMSGGLSYDIDGDGINGDFSGASVDELHLLFDWAAQAEEVLFYIIGNSDDGEIYLNDTPLFFNPDLLAVSLNQLRSSGNVKKTLVVIDSPNSGVYLDLAQEGEVIVTSCEADSPAYYLTQGTISFSSYFWLGVFNGLSLPDAFEKARDDIATAVGYQAPQFNDGADGSFFEEIDLVDETDYRQQRPVIGDIAPVQQLSLAENTLDLQVGDIADDGTRLIRVWAIITKPSDVPQSGDAVFSRPHIDLLASAPGAKGGEEDEEEFQGEYDDADEAGVYKIDYFSMDDEGNVSQGESGYGVKSGEAPGTMNFTVRRQGTASAITTATVCINPPLAPCESSNVDGIYSMLVLNTQNYGVTISAAGYKNHDANLLLQAGTTGSTIVELEPIGGPDTFHSADYNPANFQINLQELLRVIQFFNLFDFHCDEGGEDGFAPGVGDQDCTPHSSDYNPQNWKVSLQELLRLIQFFNIGGYHADVSGEDGFLPGLLKSNLTPKQAGGLSGTVALGGEGPYEVGEDLDVTLTLAYASADAVTSLGVELGIPDGFAFDAATAPSGTAPDVFRVNPQTNMIEGAWITAPAFPFSFTFRLVAQAPVAETPTVGGRAIYRTTGPEMTASFSTCTPPAAPAGVSATQTLPDRVELAWNAVTGATAYRVFRSEVNNFSQAQPISDWNTGATFIDTTALPPVQQEAGGCSSPPPPEPVRYFYWVVARSSEVCESAPGGGVQGFRAAGQKGLSAGIGGSIDLGNMLVLLVSAAGVAMSRRRRLVQA